MRGRDDGWRPFEGGATLGTEGSEDGIIARDEEHALGGRTTLERGGRNAPYAVTCGIYGSMCHTAFTSDDASANSLYEAMRDRLTAMLECSSEGDYLEMLKRFVEEF